MSTDTPRPERVALTDEERLALGRHLRKRLGEDSAERRYRDTWLQLAYAADEWFAAREQALREEIAGQIEGNRIAEQLMGDADYNSGLNLAARIARGETR